jgi:hypothetical protein
LEVVESLSVFGNLLLLPSLQLFLGFPVATTTRVSLGKERCHGQACAW